MVQVFLFQEFLFVFAIFITCFDKKNVFFFNVFSSNFDLSIHLVVIIVIHFCIASDAKLCFASFLKFYFDLYSFGVVIVFCTFLRAKYFFDAF